MSKYREKEVLEKSLFSPQKFCINHASEREVTASAQETQTPEAFTAVARTSYIPWATITSSPSLSLAGIVEWAKYLGTRENRRATWRGETLREERFSIHVLPFYARAVKQKVWNEAEYGERDWGERLKTSPHTPYGRLRLARLAPLLQSNQVKRSRR